MSLPRFVALVVCLSFSIEIAHSLPKRKKNDGVFECIISQMCKCSSSGKWQECWSHLANVTDTWIVNQTHQCGRGGNFPFGTFEDYTNHMCSLVEDDFKECYYEVTEAFKIYLDEVNADPKRKEEGNLIEKARVCGGTNLMECAQFGPGC